jgi:uncharacterized protein YndB with AHSA1/START domain
MIEFENTIDIAQPVEVVFEFLADLENLPKWNYYVTQVRKTSRGPAGNGATYHQVRKTDSQELTVHELEPNQLLTVETIPPSQPQLKRRMVFEAIKGQTRIIDRWELDTGHPQFVQVLGKSRVQSSVKENLAKLKELLETGRVTLQDGRKVSL